MKLTRRKVIAGGGAVGGAAFLLNLVNSGGGTTDEDDNVDSISGTTTPSERTPTANPRQTARQTTGPTPTQTPENGSLPYKPMDEGSLDPDGDGLVRRPPEVKLPGARYAMWVPNIPEIVQGGLELVEVGAPEVREIADSFDDEDEKTIGRDIAPAFQHYAMQIQRIYDYTRFGKHELTWTVFSPDQLETILAELPYKKETRRGLSAFTYNGFVVFPVGDYLLHTVDKPMWGGLRPVQRAGTIAKSVAGRGPKLIDASNNPFAAVSKPLDRTEYARLKIHKPYRNTSIEDGKFSGSVGGVRAWQFKDDGSRARLQMTVAFATSPPMETIREWTKAASALNPYNNIEITQPSQRVAKIVATAPLKDANITEIVNINI